MPRNPNALLRAIAPVRRLAITGASMVPALLSGDHVLVVRTRPRVGDVVALRDPREPERIVVKRVVSVDRRGIEVAGDNPSASTDSRQFGVVPHRLFVGRVVYRYAPKERAGRITGRAR
jgi:nickel-type superoxide dismutase maturation protease